MSYRDEDHPSMYGRDEAEPPVDWAEHESVEEQEARHESEPECSCYTGGIYSLGSRESIRAGDTDPFCTEHGLEDVRSGAYAAMTELQRRRFHAALASSIGRAGDE